ncbi:DUF5995 family protein [Streptomyces sp. VNUA116]|uniref:DUF5995 family protein n=1 Tax=Streptomyces sp. VNUA116 TaxID=3062449 RepID=UPI0026759FE3|nr:DUF5995 family protein [Streptomyces sp. VNUA116]WKU48616.1 DUF5995 family protein [Streptomyces sp. VNUA116]
MTTAEPATAVPGLPAPHRPHLALQAAVAAVTAAALLFTAGPAPAQARISVPAQPRSCQAPVRACVAQLEQTLASLRDRLGCAHHAPFPALYVQLQRALGDLLLRHPGLFAEPGWLARDLNTAFVHRYLQAYAADRAGQPVPEAWRIAFTAARGGGTNAGQDALLAANAHIQRDMPYVLAESGLLRPDGTSREADFNRFQIVLDQAYEPAVRDIAARYDPLIAVADDRWNPVGGVTAHELFTLWRRTAWTQARRLAAARSAEELRSASRAVESNATAWGTLLAAVRVPGYDAVRDAYCHGIRPPVAHPPRTAWTALPLPLPAGLRTP